MYYAIDIPNFGDYSNIHKLIELAKDAERVGWDGYFLWDHMCLSSTLYKEKKFGTPFLDLNSLHRLIFIE